ncbi:uncharacterized protein DS421_5g157650 [Arachis hypogaea]|nr:uncharacterized protein DS421_5g157650 [Arachis hypogaea]
MCSALATAPAMICSNDNFLSGVILQRDCVLSPVTISSGKFSSCCTFSSGYNLCVRASDLLHQCFSSIDEICCTSACGIELCSATSTSPLSFVEHLGF